MHARLLASLQARGRLAQARVIELAEDVSAHGEKHRGRAARFEQRQCLGDAARGFERHGFRGIGEPHAEARTVAEGCFDLLAEPGMIDDDLDDARLRQALDLPDDERLAAGVEQWLGPGVGEGPHPVASARSENHGRRQCMRHRLRRFQKV